ncbi:hypothetical protein M3Y97_01098600 [Aphelenchoides bicaudatus]|nr:hypothetical protein M3Y97_01098600 [Aphelenchoides bicaudatus]
MNPTLKLSPKIVNCHKSGSQKMNLTVYIGTHDISVVASSEDRIDDLKFVLERRTGIPSKNIHLIHRGDELKDKNLGKLDDGATLFLRGGLDLYLHLPNGKTHMFLVYDAWEVSVLHSLIKRKVGISTDIEISEIGGKLLDLNASLSFRENNVQKDSAIVLKNYRQGSEFLFNVS